MNEYFNPLSSCHNKDKELYNRFISEAFTLHGVEMIYYVTSYDTTYDKIFGEDNNRRFVRRFNLNVYYTLPNEDELWTKFGIEGIDNFHMYAAKEYFAAMSTTSGSGDTLAFEVYDEYTPLVGDIIKAGYNDYYYEIVDVGEEEEMFLQGKHTWDFTVKPYKDEHLSLGAAVSATEISGVTDQTDSLTISGDIDTGKEDILYTQPDSETSPNDPFGGW